MKRRLAGLLAVALAGCSVPERAGFEDVEKAVGERMGQRVAWNRGGEEDEEVRKLVAELFARELTVESAVQIALLNNAELQAEYEDLGIAQADLVQAGLLKNPTFLGSVKFPTRSGIVTGYEFEIVQEFLDLLMFPGRKKLASFEFQRVKLRAADKVVELAGRARAAWFRFVAAQQSAEVHREISKAADASAELADRMKDAGNLSELAVSREHDLAESARKEWIQSELEVAEAREELNVVLGAWGGQTAWTAPRMLPEVPELEVPLDGIESLAIARRLDLLAALQEREASQARLDQVKAFRWLGVLEVGYGAHREVEPEVGWLHGPSVALSLPIFDQGQATLFSLRSELRRRESLNRDLAVRIRSEVRAARTRLMTLRRLSEHQRHVVIPLRERIVELALREYNFMLIGVAEVLRAKQEAYDAWDESIELARDYWIARSELERAVGGKLPENSK